MKIQIYINKLLATGFSIPCQSNPKRVEPQSKPQVKTSENSINQHLVFLYNYAKIMKCLDRLVVGLDNSLHTTVQYKSQNITLVKKKTPKKKFPTLKL